MKDAFNSFLPIMEGDMNMVSKTNEFRSLTNISSNGYYGYQPVIEKRSQGEERTSQSMDVQMEESDIQFNNFIPAEENEQYMNDDRGQLKRKRCWGYDYEAEFPEFKKRRQSENMTITEEVSTPNCMVNIRMPTHNIPDLPRCLMGHFV